MTATRLLSPVLAPSLLVICSVAIGQAPSRFDQGMGRQNQLYAQPQQRVGAGTSNQELPNYWRDESDFNNSTPQYRNQPQLVAQASPRPATVRAEVHGKLDFGIPFDLSARADAIGQVRLYVSTDLGRNWQLYDRRPPEAKGFQFRAEREGEYWFAVRTTDRSGRQTTENPTKPELRVIVDTTQPQLDLRVNADADGRVIAEWSAQDQQLAIQSFRLFYQDDRGDWQQVRTQLPQRSEPAHQWQARTRWNVQTTAQELTVVAEIQDEAENVTRVRKRVALDNAQVASTRPRFDTQETANVRGSRTVGRSVNDFREGVKNFFGGTARSDTSIGGRTQGAAQNGSVAQGNPQFQTQPQFSQVSSRANSSLPQRGDIESPVAERRPQGFSNSDLSARNPTTQFQPSTNFGSIGQRPRITSSPNFEIDYELRGVDQRGAKRVELWLTRDDGRTWELYGSDTDQRSPMEVQLQQEGLYGFRLIVHGHDGRAPQPPKSNSPADVWVAADWNKPVGRITRAMIRESQSYANRGGKELVVQWVAQDALLDELPIMLNVASSPEGPWFPVATPLHNKGSHTWQIDRELPPRLFVQMQIRDIAGNITSTVYDVGAANGDGPSASIIDIRPPSKSAFRPGNFR